ncbi:radical SAM protein [Catellatospora sp. KI3]|uniref:radical SAM protein n=1 Tax=Catellatospora sp. KI3 TaxID=3041620 RepID=UPI002482D95A|nr:radical SAM protein [Catellatospora sp. KI3]MDI1462213.1 radical SAM protein [Catellatospora sp. KI3]
MSIRLIPADDGWWCVTGPRVARLPMEAVVDGVLVEEARAVLDQNGFYAPPARPFGVTVLTATSCNLGCAYCFQNSGPAQASPFAPPRIKRALLSDNTISLISGFVQERMQQLSFDSLTVLLFGGEPLLNPTGCLGILRALQPLGMVHAEMISNTVLLRPHLAAQLHAAGLRRIQVTFDGARTEHDHTRIDHRGDGTYDRIMTNIRAAAAAVPELEWHYRVNISHHNIDGIELLIDDLAQLPTSKPASLHLALIDDVGVGYENTVFYSTGLAERFLGLISRAMDRGLHVPVMGTSVADCPFCGEFAGGTGAVVNADGTLYSCWETAGRPEWAVGTVTEGYLPDADINDRWVACDYAAASHGDNAEVRKFYDRVDAYILDRTHRPQRALANAAAAA